MNKCKPKVVYANRKPGCNPRTGEHLPPWWEVQVMDPTFGPWDSVECVVEVKTEEGSRWQRLTARYPRGASPEVAIVQHALALQFQPTGATFNFRLVS